MGHNLMDLQVGGVSRFRVFNSGGISANGVYVNGTNRAFITSPSDSIILLYNSGGDNFNRLQLGGTTTAFPAIKRNGAAIEARLADDSNYTDINALNFNLENFGYVGSRTNSGYRISFPNTGIITYTAPNGHSLNSSTIIGATGGSLNASAILQADSTTKGFLPPRGSNAQMLAIASPATGLIFFDTTNNKLNCYDGTNWQPCW
jgi:hypothetical protein